MSAITSIQKCYQKLTSSQSCTGVIIETINNCKWSVAIDLFDTMFEDLQFKAITVYKSENNWFTCIKENGMFKGDGAIGNLEDILGIFDDWINSDFLIQPTY